MSELKTTFEQIYEHWGFGGSESRSGPGSSLEETETIRNAIKKLVKEKNIRTVIDIPCGDFNWMKDIVYSFEKYTGGDIVKQAIIDNKKYANDIISFMEFDLAGTEEIPEADLLIVRDVIGHLPLTHGVEALENILRSKCKYLLSTSWVNVNNKEYYKTHKNKDVSIGRFYPVCLQSEPFNLPEPELYIEESVVVDGYEDGNRKALVLWDLQKIKNRLKFTNVNKTDVTIVTGLWDMGRDKLDSSFSRSYENYKEQFINLLKTPVNMFIYVSKEDEELVWKHRSKSNTYVKVMELSEFTEWFGFYKKVQEIRTDEKWYTQAEWLTQSPQARLKYYNPIVMSKMFLLNDASIFNPFNTEYFYWLDAGICNTVHSGYFWHDKVLENLPTYSDVVDKFTFISYPYIGGEEIHGFPRKEMEKYCNTDYVKYVCRGGFFGGKVKHINQINSIYYNILNLTLTDGFMGTEESIFTIISHLYSRLINNFTVNDDGLIWPFFEALKNIDSLIDTVLTKKITKTNLYVLGFNSPNQFKKLCESFERSDKNFLDLPRKILINNSTDQSTFTEYDQLCELYGFEEIHFDNIGICGGRQYIAEHFENSNAEFCIFFEDDMTLVDSSYTDKSCKLGFRRYASNLYETIHSIMEKERFDFLKLSFSEFYGDNSVQWAWYNVPQTVRSSVWSSYDKLPETGLDANSPRTQFKNINVLDTIPYISGEVYYSNWPQIVSKAGNKKMFLTEKWAKPFEQTWMSYIFQETFSGKINPAVLLLSPVEHDRFDHYSGKERREN